MGKFKGQSSTELRSLVTIKFNPGKFKVGKFKPGSFLIGVFTPKKLIPKKTIRPYRFPLWAVLSLIMNGLLLSAVLLLLYQSRKAPVSPSPGQVSPLATSLPQNSSPSPILGSRHQLTYQQWVDLLDKEAKFAATHRPKNLTILVGDSLSLWFPSELLPKDRSWLNQGISGETSAGLLNRLDLLDRTRPNVIFVMIGINDLIRQVPSETLLANHREIVRYLRRNHPRSTIVVQSILPHASKNATWEGKDRLLAIPNSRIQTLNQELKTMTQREGAEFLDLYPLFADEEGNLHRELTSDGLHLSQQGYWVWRYALQVFIQLQEN